MRLMGPLKTSGLLVAGLTFLYGFGPADDLWIVTFGMLGFVLCLCAPNDI